MKKTAALIVALMLCAGLFTGCGKYSTDTTTLFVKGNGKVVATSVESFDTASYSADELKAYVKTQIDNYNAQTGSKSVKLKKLKVKDGYAMMTIAYASSECYSEFNDCTLFVGTVSEAMESGYQFSGDFAEIMQNGSDFSVSLCGADQFLGSSRYRVAITDETQLVSCSGKICFSSTSSVEMIDAHTASIAPGNTLFGSEETESETEDAEMTVNGTEAMESASDGSIGEDDLLETDQDAGEDGSEVTFDFGDDTVTDGSGNAYVYLIFK